MGWTPELYNVKYFSLSAVIGSTSIERRFYTPGYFGWLFHFARKKESIITINENVSAYSHV